MSWNTEVVERTDLERVGQFVDGPYGKKDNYISVKLNTYL